LPHPVLEEAEINQLIESLQCRIRVSTTCTFAVC